MAPGRVTRSQRVRDDCVVDTDHLNNSYITIVSSDVNSGDGCGLDALSVTRDKLATTEYRVMELTEENETLKAQLREMRMVLESKRTTIEDLRMAIAGLGGGMKIVKDGEAQTDPVGLVDAGVQVESCALVSVGASVTGMDGSNADDLGAIVEPQYCGVSEVSDGSWSRVLLLGDSHVRGLSGMLGECERAEKWKVSGVCMPNATFDEVIMNSRSCADLTLDDCLIVCAGANDCLRGGKASDAAILKLKEMSSHTNVVITTVPYWRDRPVLNAFIYDFNNNIYKNFSGLDRFSIFDINEVIDRRMFTRHGLHMTKRGKRKLVLNIADFIETQRMYAAASSVNWSNLKVIECRTGAVLVDVEPVCADDVVGEIHQHRDVCVESCVDFQRT